MLHFYEKKGRKFFIIIVIMLVVAFSLLLIINEFAAFNKEMAQVDISIENAARVSVAQMTQQKMYNGQIEYIEGLVEKRRGKNTGWFSANKSDIIKNGDEVRTLASGRAIITFEDGSSLRLDENTHIVFHVGKNTINIDMENGSTFNTVAKDDNRVYAVHAHDYIVTALGTEFGVEDAGDGVNVIVIESAVDVKDKNNNIINTIEEGTKATVVNNKTQETKIRQKDLDDEFVAWSTEDAQKNNDTKKEDKEEKVVEKKNDETSVKKGAIVLSGEKSSSGVRLHWDVSGVNTNNGFKVVKSKEAYPVYPGNDYKYLSDSDVRDYKWKIDTGNEYHFRVCAYQGDGNCGVYSNDVSVDTPSDHSNKKEKDDEKYASKVSLSATKDGDNVKLKWDISGGDAPKGFKVVKSKDKNPVYPGDDYKYLSDNDTRKYTWKDLKEDKSYHFRVCIYKGGKCGAYSNDVKVSL